MIMCSSSDYIDQDQCLCSNVVSVHALFDIISVMLHSVSVICLLTVVSVQCIISVKLLPLLCSGRSFISACYYRCH